MPVWQRTAPPLLTLVAIWILMPFAYACPEECACLTLPQGTRVHCRYQQLRHVPDGFPSDTFEIDFGHNILESITAKTFTTLPNLKRLVLDFCQIQQIHDFAFSHLKSLVYLSLSDNKIRRISDYAFDGLNTIEELHLDLNELEQIPKGAFNGMELETLSLKGNRLNSLEKDVFQGAKITNLILDENSLQNVSKDTMQPLSNSLKSLHLSRNKEPLTLQEETFSNFKLSDLTVTFAGVKSSSFLCKVNAGSIDISGNPFQTLDFRDCGGLSHTTEFYLRNLSLEFLDDTLMSALTNVTKLDLSHNKILFIDGDNFKHTPRLKSLDVSSNNLGYLPENLGEHLSNLEVLKLTSNKIAEISFKSFAGMTNLKELWLDHNKIQIIPGDMKDLFNSLQTIQLVSNALHCNCEMRWFREWLEETSLGTGADECISPMNGYIWQYDPDKFVCSTPNITRMTSNMNVQRGANIFLTCTAGSDPAPEVEWDSPFGDVVSVLPPFNRTDYRTSAIWQVKDIQSNQAGWYKCTAKNLHGSVEEHIYINVLTNDSSQVDLSTLTYPGMPQTPPITTTVTTTTPAATTTAAATTSTESQTTSTEPQTTVPSTTTVQPTTVTSTTLEATTTESKRTTTESTTTAEIAQTSPIESSSQSQTSSKTTTSSELFTTTAELSDSVSSTSSTASSSSSAASSSLSSPSTDLSDSTPSDTAEWRSATSSVAPVIKTVGPNQRSEGSDESLPQSVIIAIIAGAVGVVVIALVITLAVHYIMKYKKSKAYSVTRSSDTNNTNNNAPTSLLKDSRLAEV